MAAQPLTFDTLVKFHREVVVPDIERIVGRVDSKVDNLRDEMRVASLEGRITQLENDI